MILNMGGGGVVPKVNLDATTITPGTKNKVIKEKTYLRGALTVLGDSDLIPENIKNGVDVFGVVGTVIEGVDLSQLGVSKSAVDIITPSQDITSLSNIQHSLGIVPKYIIITTNGTVTDYMNQYSLKKAIASAEMCVGINFKDVNDRKTGSVSLLNTSFTLDLSLTLRAGITYKIITMG